jgi:hypothetical protein
LLGPHWPLHVHLFVNRGVPRANSAALIHQEGARSPGANIDAKPHM